MATIIAPSILSADFGNLEKDCKMLNKSEADWFHIDIMDGVFVPNISFGMPVLASIQNHAEKPLDVHLMIVDPDRSLRSLQSPSQKHSKNQILWNEGWRCPKSSYCGNKFKRRD
jgi:ribulose-phosphate 3-epimerase